MCYPCTNCGRCGKFDPSSPLYTPPPSIPCLKCGGTIDAATGICDSCGDQAFVPTGGMMASANSLRPDAVGNKGTDPSLSNDAVGNKGTDPFEEGSPHETI